MAEERSYLTLSEAADRYRISAPTLRRLCDAGQLHCQRVGRGWQVRPGEVERYLLTRRPPGNPPALIRLEGPAANARLFDGVGWEFSVAISGRRSRVTIWLTHELVDLLSGEFDVRELVVGASEPLIQEALLERDALPEIFEITLLARDRATLLRAAGAGPEYYMAAEAPAEAGVVIRRQFTAVDFAREGLWPGDTLTDVPHGFEDVVVETVTTGSFRYVRTVRVPLEATHDRRRAGMVRAACDAYTTRCARTGQRPMSWVAPVLERLEVITTSQQRVLQTTYEYFSENGDWPAYKYVAALLDRDYGLDMQEVLPTIPRQYLYGYPEPYRQGERVSLSIVGIAECPESQADIAAYMRALMWMVERQKSFIPDPVAPDQELRVTSEEMAVLLADTGRPIEVALRKFYLLIQQDTAAFGGGGGAADLSSWSLIVAPTIRRYRGVQLFSEYVEQSGKLQPPAPLWRMPYASGLGAEATAWGVGVRDGGGHRGGDVATYESPSEAGAERAPSIFVVMPFNDELAPIYEAIRDAANSLGPSLNARCLRADDIAAPGRITQQIVDAIRSADLIVADMTGSNANVLFEVGYADALDKPIIALNQDVESAPFDIRDWRQIPYAADDLGELRRRLARALLETLPRND